MYSNGIFYKLGMAFSEAPAKILFVPAAISLISCLPLPIGFYTFSRITLFGFGLWVAIKLFKNSLGIWLLYAGIAILFNPILPVYLHNKGIWVVLDIMTAAAFMWAALKSNWNKNNSIKGVKK
tara:strand:- start:1056 stop:1424 length:369 start_codon:yes stop_codon:yes gene_type:complete